MGRFELAYKLFGHDGCVNSLHFNESGNLLASGSDDLDIIVWDWEKKRKRYSFSSGHNANIFQSKFLPFRGDTHIVSTSRDGQVRKSAIHERRNRVRANSSLLFPQVRLAELSSTGSCRSTKRLALHRGPANKLSLLPESPHSFLTGGEDGVVYCIDVRESKPTKLLVQRKDDGSGGRDERKVPICSVDVNPKDDYVFCTAGRDQYLRIYDRRFLSRSSPLPAKKFCPHHLVSCAVFLNVAHFIASPSIALRSMDILVGETLDPPIFRSIVTPRPISRVPCSAMTGEKSLDPTMTMTSTYLKANIPTELIIASGIRDIGTV